MAGSEATTGQGGRGARILLARISRAHGIRGDVLLETFTEVPASVAAYGPLTDESGARHFRLTVVRTTPKGVVARIEGVGDRTAAEALKGTTLHVERARLPAPAAEEFYQADLIGLEARDEGGVRVGLVVSVQNFGAGDILEIAFDPDGRIEFVPFQAAFVPVVDIEGGHVLVRLPEVN